MTFLLIKNYTIPLVRLTSLWIVFDTIQIVIGYVLRSVGDTLFMMVIYLVMPFLFYIILPYIIVVVAKLPLFWVWVELVVFTMCMLLIVSARFLGGKWKRINMI
ncbi:hypothetical protein SY88_07355 [Clostridiales bacterium PH28_bin88]|nr:hypothetical protein SY88_07355 [Clostridiales bacterium PH28_bin88]